MFANLSSIGREPGGTGFPEDMESRLGLISLQGLITSGKGIFAGNTLLPLQLQILEWRYGTKSIKKNVIKQLTKN